MPTAKTPSKCTEPRESTEGDLLGPLLLTPALPGPSIRGEQTPNAEKHPSRQNDPLEQASK